MFSRNFQRCSTNLTALSSLARSTRFFSEMRQISSEKAPELSSIGEMQAVYNDVIGQETLDFPNDAINKAFALFSVSKKLYKAEIESCIARAEELDKYKLYEKEIKCASNELKSDEEHCTHYHAFKPA